MGKRKNKVVVINNSYEQFLWLPEWAKYGKTVPPVTPALNFYMAIAKYGLDCIEPKGLRDEDLKYFNEFVRPELDRQHREMDKRINRKRI